MVMSSVIKVFQPVGLLDSTQAVSFREKIDELVAEGADVILIDLQDVTFIDSSGLGLLVTALKRIRSVKGRLCICSTNEQVRMLFELTSMDRVFESFADQEAFYAELQKA